METKNMEKGKLTLVFIAIFVIIYVLLTTIPRATDTAKNMNDLKDFLQQDKTDEHPYTSTYNCYNYSRDLQANATKQGFKCHQVYLGTGPVDHTITLFDISEGLFFVEPQSDEIVNPFIEYPGETFITIWT